MSNPSGTVTGYLNSPRNQRRLLVVSIAVFVAGVAVFLALVVFRGSSDTLKSPISTTPASLYHPDKKAPVSKEELTLARRFIETAVERRDLGAAYDLVNPDLKGTMTRKQWETGNIPVVSYKADNAETAAFITDYSYKTSALFEVDLVAKPGEDGRPELRFFIGLKRAGGKPNGRWLVNYWEPHWRPPVPAAPN